MLSVYLESFENAIAFQVTSQSSSITDYIKKFGPFTASNGWSIKIDNAPELDVRTKSIFLRGSNASLDKRVDRTWDMNSNYSRDNVVSAVDKALNELASAVASPSLYTTAPWLPTPKSVVSANGTINKPLIKG